MRLVAYVDLILTPIPAALLSINLKPVAPKRLCDVRLPTLPTLPTLFTPTQAPFVIYILRTLDYIPNTTVTPITDSQQAERI